MKEILEKLNMSLRELTVLSLGIMFVIAGNFLDALAEPSALSSGMVVLGMIPVLYIGYKKFVK
jgi:uncharacterized membrane protein